jgi:hypothetical protein
VKESRLDKPCNAEEGDEQMDKRIPGCDIRSQKVWIERFRYRKHAHSAGDKESEERRAFHFEIFSQPARASARGAASTFAGPAERGDLRKIEWGDVVDSQVSKSRPGAPDSVLIQDKGNRRSFGFAQDDTAVGGLVSYDVFVA